MDGGCTTPGGGGVGQVMRTLQVTDSGDYSLFFLYKGRLVRSSLESDLRYFAQRVNLIDKHTIIQKIICKHDLYIFFAPCGKNEVKGSSGGSGGSKDGGILFIAATTTTTTTPTNAH